MKTKEQPFSLGTFDAAIEQFDLAAEKVFKNIKDPNTGSQAREITLKVKMIPDEHGMINFESSVATKTAPPRMVKGKLIVGFEGGKWIGRELVVQQQLPFPQAEVVAIPGKEQNE